MDLCRHRPLVAAWRQRNGHLGDGVAGSPVAVDLVSFRAGDGDVMSRYPCNAAAKEWTDERRKNQGCDAGRLLAGTDGDGHLAHQANKCGHHRHRRHLDALHWCGTASEARSAFRFAIIAV